MTVSIHQPQYLPWLGYFDKINKSDVFVLLDNVQFKKNEWQNRNKIRNKDSWQWLTVPVKYKFLQLINEVKSDNSFEWKQDHYKGLVCNYSKSPYFKDYKEFFEGFYNDSFEMLSNINSYLIRNIIDFLGIKTEIVQSSVGLDVPGRNTELLLNICQKLGADTYLSGIGGKGYLDVSLFDKAGIKVIFQEFKHPIYQQTFSGFESNMSIIDLLFNHGKDSLKIIEGKI